MAGFKNIKESTNNTSSGLKDKVNNFKQSVNDNVVSLNEASNIQKQSRSYNKMFGAIPNRTSLVNSNNPMGSWVKYGRYNILPRSVAFEFNTYKNWAPFSILMEPNNYENGEPGEHIDSYTDDLGRKINEIYHDPLIKDSGIIGRKSLFNPFAAVNETNAVRMSINAPLLDSPQASIERMKANDCGIKALVDASTSGRLGVATYSYADFMYCKYLGKCSNEYLITLRRFAYPPGDHINTVDYNNTGIENETQHHTNDIGRMVTWMGTPGNEMGNILKYSVKIPYKEFTAKMQEVDENKSTSDGVLASIMNLGDKRNLQLIEAGSGSTGSTKMLQSALGLIPSPIGKMGGFIGDPPYTSDDWKKNYDQNKSYGPLDVITKTWKRAGADDGEGLGFDQDITLQFDYELRSYDGINGRAAMMDLLSNILATCYTTGKFWGGSTRFLGASQSNVYANLPIFMRDNGDQKPGDFAAYSKHIADSFNMTFRGGDDEDAIEKRRDTEVKTYKAEKKKNKKDSKGSGVIEKATSIFSDIGSLIQNAGSALGSLLYGGLINKLGRPAVLAVNSLLSDAPTGLWHLTIGNPKAPIMSMGNMIIDNCEIEHTGPLGIDGFPTGLSVKIKLKHGKPRENTAIERMYMQGDYRIYSPMGDKVLKMYWGAPSLAMMAASNVRQNQINERKISEEDYRKSQFYVDDYVDDFTKVAPKDSTTDTINLARYFGTVATIKADTATSPTVYLTNTSKEALFGSTSTKQAQNNDKRDELLEKRYRALGNRVEEEKKLTEAKDNLNAANEDLNAFKEVQSEGIGGHDVFLWSWGVNRDSLKVTWEAAMGDSDMGINYSFEFTGDPSTWMDQYKEMVSSLKGHKNYNNRNDNDKRKKNFDTQTSEFEKTLTGIIAAKQRQLKSQETINEVSAAKSNAG